MRLAAAALLLALPALAAPKPRRSPRKTPAVPETAASAATRALDEAQALLAARPGRDARGAAELEAKARAKGEALVARWGWRAAAPLGEAAADKKRPAGARLLAAAWLAFTRDPAAVAPLRALLLDPEQDEFVRAAAAQSLPLLDAPRSAAREALCRALEDAALPRQVLDDALTPLASLGCPSPEALERLARAWGPRPEGRDLRTVSRAVAALGASPGREPALALLRLLAYLAPGADARAEAARAAAARSRELALWSPAEGFAALEAAALSESSRPDAAAPLARALADFGAPAAKPLFRLLSHPDAEVLVCAAEGLARLKSVEALPSVTAALDGAMNDPRFAPRPGRPDPAALLARLEAAAAALRRAAASR